MSLSGLIPALKTGTAYTVTRTVAGTMTSGRYSGPGAASTFEIAASVQPLNGKDLKAVPEAERTSHLRKLYTETALQTRTATNEADSVLIDGESHKVISVEYHEGFGFKHYKTVVSRVGNL